MQFISGLAASEPSGGGSPPPGSGGGSFTPLFSSAIHNHPHLGPSVQATGCLSSSGNLLPPPGKLEKPDVDDNVDRRLVDGGATTEDDDDDEDSNHDGEDKDRSGDNNFGGGKRCRLEDDERGCSPPSIANHHLAGGGADCFMADGQQNEQFAGLDGILRPQMSGHGSSRSPYDWMKRPGLEMMETGGSNGSRPCKEGTAQFDGKCLELYTIL